MKKAFLVLSLISICLFVASCGSSSKFTVFGAPTLSAAVADVSSTTTTYYGSPTSLKITMYAVWVSTNADCTGLVSLADYGTAGQEFNMFDDPALFHGSPADGSYNCMVIKMLDTMKFKPALSDGTGICVAGNEYTFDIARGQDEPANLPWVDNNFNAITTDANPNIVYLFATTDPTKTLAKHVSIDQTIPLTSAMVSPGQTTLVMDFTNRVYVDTYHGTQCWLDSPTMAFK